MNTGSAAQRVNTDARIICKDKPLNVCAVIQRLFTRILLEGRSVLNADGQIIETRYRFNGDPSLDRRLAELS